MSRGVEKNNTIAAPAIAVTNKKTWRILGLIMVDHEPLLTKG
jgi:hypothetical protein